MGIFPALTPPPPLIGLFAVGRGQTPTATQSAEEAGLLRLLLLHPGDGAVSSRRRRLHPEEPLSREQPRPHRLRPKAERRDAAGSRKSAQPTLCPERIADTATANVSKAHEQEQQLKVRETH